MNLGQIRAQMLNYLDDVNGGYFGTVFTTQAINNATLKLQKMLLDASQYYYLKCAQTYTQYGQQDYALPFDFRKEMRLELVTGGTPPNEVRVMMTYITLNNQNWFLQSPAQPTTYTITGNKLKLYPVPDQAYILRIFYAYQIPLLVNDYDTPDVPDYYQMYIAALAAKEGFIKDDRENSKVIEMIKDLEEMIRQDAAERNQDMSRDINVTSQGYAGLYY